LLLTCINPLHHLLPHQAATTQLQSFIEDTAPPYVQLVFETPAAFFSELTRDSLAGLMAAVAAAHPDTTLGVLVLGLKSHVQRIDNQSMRQVRMRTVFPAGNCSALPRMSADGLTAVQLLYPTYRAGCRGWQLRC
jgi:hypothetical protein